MASALSMGKRGRRFTSPTVKSIPGLRDSRIPRLRLAFMSASTYGILGG